MEEELQLLFAKYQHLGDKQIGQAMVNKDKEFAINILLNFYSHKNQQQNAIKSNNQDNPAI